MSLTRRRTMLSEGGNDMGQPILLAESTLETDSRTFTVTLSEETSECDFWRVIFDNVKLNKESLIQLLVNGATRDFFGSNNKYILSGDVGIARGILPESGNNKYNRLAYVASNSGACVASGRTATTIALRAYRESSVIKAGAHIAVYGYKY